MTCSTVFALVPAHLGRCVIVAKHARMAFCTYTVACGHTQKLPQNYSPIPFFFVCGQRPHRTVWHQTFLFHQWLQATLQTFKYVSFSMQTTTVTLDVMQWLAPRSMIQEVVGSNLNPIHFLVRGPRTQICSCGFQPQA